jgi:hypothetical protein
MSQEKIHLGIAVGIQDGCVTIQFDRAVTWVGLPPAAAQELAGTILQKVRECPDYSPGIVIAQ